MCDSRPQGLTVFGFGQEEAALRTFVSNEDGSKEVLAALELGADRAAEVGDVVGEAHDTDRRAIRLAFVPAGGEKTTLGEQRRRVVMIMSCRDASQKHIR